MAGTNVTCHDPLAEAQATIDSLREKLEAAIDIAPPEGILEWRPGKNCVLIADSLMKDKGRTIHYCLDATTATDGSVEWSVTWLRRELTSGGLYACLAFAEESERETRDELSDVN